MKPEYKYIGHLPTSIVKLLWRNNKKQRRDFVKELNYARTTIFDNLKKLEIRGIVEKEEVNNGKRGRPIKVWYLSEDFIEEMENEIEDEQMPKL